MLLTRTLRARAKLPALTDQLRQLIGRAEQRRDMTGADLLAWLTGLGLSIPRREALTSVCRAWGALAGTIVNQRLIVVRRVGARRLYSLEMLP